MSQKQFLPELMSKFCCYFSFSLAFSITGYYVVYISILDVKKIGAYNDRNVGNTTVKMRTAFRKM